MAKVRLIGDVHAKMDAYKKIVDAAPEGSIQLGDMSSSPKHHKWLIENIDGVRHSFFGGNHDCYGRLAVPHNLGDYGLINGYNQSMFFVRGAFSIDKQYQIQNHVWCPNEELNAEERQKCLELYNEVKPDIMLSHCCPTFVERIIGSPSVLLMFGFSPSTFTTKTGNFLQQLFEVHIPKQWYFGHFHKSWTEELMGCQFTCLAELEYKDIEV